MSRGIHTNPDPELDTMIQEVLDDTATARTRDRLRARLEHDPTARARYSEFEAVFAQLGRLERVEFRVDARTAPAPRSARRARPVRSGRWRQWLGVTTAIAAGLVGVVLWRGDLGPGIDAQAPGTLIAGERAAATVVETVGDVTVRLTARRTDDRIELDARLAAAGEGSRRVGLRLETPVGQVERAMVTDDASFVLEPRAVLVDFTAAADARIEFRQLSPGTSGLLVDVQVGAARRIVPVPIVDRDFSTNPGAPDR